MYADYSRDQINAFLTDLTNHQVTKETNGMAEDFSDDMIMATMELQRYKKAEARNETFVPRAERLMQMRSVHPADFV